MPGTTTVLDDGRAISRVRFALQLAPGEHLAGFGERFDALDHRGTQLEDFERFFDGHVAHEDATVFFGAHQTGHDADVGLPFGHGAHDVVGQTLAQMAIAWALRDARVTSALIGARNVEQLDNSLDAVKQLTFSADELKRIDEFSGDGHVDLWRESSSIGRR